MIQPPTSGSLQVVDARAPYEVNPLVPAAAYHLDAPGALARLQALLLRLYPADHPVTLEPGGGQPARQVPLDCLAEQASLGPEATLAIPPMAPDHPTGSPYGLRQIVHRLRAPGGCPWDREQTPRSLTRFVLEEAHEVVDAIESGDPRAVEEELGDLLLQVYLQSEIAAEDGSFDLTDVVDGLTRKLIRRHPHVFGTTEVANAAEVELNWESLKQAEKPERPASVLDSIPRSLPALARAQTVQRKLIKSGFTWPDRQGALDKLDEELAELRAAPGDPAVLAHELGDVLFMLARLAGDAGVDAEAALRGTIQRVTERYRYVEQAAAQRGASVADLGTEAMLALWDEAKRGE